MKVSQVGYRTDKIGLVSGFIMPHHHGLQLWIGLYQFLIVRLLASNLKYYYSSSWNTMRVDRYRK